MVGASSIGGEPSGTTLPARPVLLDTNVVISDGRRYVGTDAVKSVVTDVELAALVRQGRINMPQAAAQIPSIGLPGIDARIAVRGQLTPGRPGNFADGIRGGTGLERGLTVITRDKDLQRALDALGIPWQAP